MQTGLKILDVTEPSCQNSLILQINLELLELFYLTCNYSEVQNFSGVLLNNNYDTLERVQIYQLKALSYFAEFKLQKSIENACHALALPKIDINVPQDPLEIEKRTNPNKSFT